MSIDLASLTARLSPEQQRAVKAQYRARAKNSTTAFLLCFFLGIFGAHRFYLGDITGGVVRLVLSPLIIPGIILEIIDLLRIDAEVEHRNLATAEGIIARAMLDHPDPHFQTQAGQLVDASLAPEVAAPPATPAAPAPIASVAPIAPVAAAAVPLAAAAITTHEATPEAAAAPPAAPAPAASEPIAEGASPQPSPPIWPVSPEYQPETPAPAAEPALTAPAATDAPPALRHESDLTPYPPVDAPPAAPAPMADTAPWGEATGGAVAGGMAAAILGAHDAPPAATPLDEPMEAAPAAAPAAVPAAAPALAGVDPTDQAAHYTEHNALADIGEPLSEPVRVTFPDATADAATSTLVFQHEDVPAHEAAWLPEAGVGAAAALGVAAAYEHFAHHEPATPPEPAAAAAPEPEPAPAAPESIAAMAAEPEHRTVKRVRVVRRLMVDGKVVQETAAEEVVDADADTAAAAARLRESLGATDPDTLASLAQQSVETEHAE